MSRVFPLLFVLGGCEGGVLIADTDTDVEVVDSDTEDPNAIYDGATLRIVSPSSGAFLALEEPRTFTAELLDAAGEPLDYDGVTWKSSSDLGWAATGLSFPDTALHAGLHDITAEAELPNGDRLAYTAGGILLQSKWAGTYAGLFSGSISAEYQGTPIVVTCTGAALVVIDATGENGDGTSDCLISLNGFDIPASFVFDLTNDNGQLAGSVAADIGITTIPFDATGTLEESGALSLTFGGNVFIGDLDGSVSADRISRETGTN